MVLDSAAHRWAKGPLGSLRAQRYNSGFMQIRLGNGAHLLCLAAVLLTGAMAYSISGACWSNVLTDSAGKPVAAAIVKLHSTAGNHDYSSTTARDGKFAFRDIGAGSYEVSVTIPGKTWKATVPVAVQESAVLTMALRIPDQGLQLRVVPSGGELSATASGGQHRQAI